MNNNLQKYEELKDDLVHFVELEPEYIFYDVYLNEISFSTRCQNQLDLITLYLRDYVFQYTMHFSGMDHSFVVKPSHIKDSIL